MVVSTERGFTVIEVMLFLGVTGALFAALMFGVTGSINQQRYRESVVGLSALLQGQYNEVLNTRNDANTLELNNSDNKFSCSDTNGVSKDAGNTTYRGTSNCVLLGKAIQIKNGNEIDIYHIIGYDPAATQAAVQNGNPAPANNCPITATNSSGAPQALNDIDTLRQYNPKFSTDFDPRTDAPEWNSTIATVGQQHNPLSASFLIMRSPKSGLIRVFTNPDSLLPSNLCTMITSTNPIKSIQMCVESDTLAVAARQSVTIDPYVSGPAGVVINQTDDQLCA